MKIAIACDHGGFALKEELVKFLLAASENEVYGEKIEIMDLGTNSEESVDYPIYGHKCAKAVASGKADRGVLCCGTGIGISIAANKVKGIRCALCTSVDMARLCREHNNANMIAFGGRTTELPDAIEMLDTYLKTPFAGGRHERRVNMIEEDI